MTKTFTRIAAICLLALAAAVSEAPAAPPNPPPAGGGADTTNSADSGQDDYAAFLRRDGKAGPAPIAFRDQAVLDLPAGYAFIPEEPAKKLMTKFGNDTDETFIGMILPAKPDTWFVTVEYLPSGYIKDEDARNWNADDLLKTIREGTEAANKKHAADGTPALEVVGWVEKPHYDAATRRLVWSIEARSKDDQDQVHSIINYKTLMLGREGYVSMVMVTDLADIEAQKPIANLLLSKLNFDKGKRYADFDSSTDRIAEYGLAALIAGVAVKKLGLIALAAAFVLKFAKVIAVAVFGGIAAFRRFFRRTKAEPDASP